MSIVLHRTSDSRMRLVGETDMALIRLSEGWRLRTLHHQDWAERNQDLFTVHFRTLKEARATIEAALALDPITWQQVDESAITELERIGPGHYRGRLLGTPADFVQAADRRWRIEGESALIRNLDHMRFGSMWHLRTHFDTRW